jgi:hypothetical protein
MYCKLANDRVGFAATACTTEKNLKYWTRDKLPLRGV